MHTVNLHLSDGRTLMCPRVVTGQHLTALLELPTVTLGTATPLKNGDVLRHFCFVGPNEKLHDLGDYHDLFQSSRAWVGRIERL
jgi:hypothetical protein